MIAVVGSVNQDLVARVEHHPVPGETVLGTGHESMSGGKGANQAVAAARLGSEVVFVGRVGSDEAGRDLIGELERDGVDVTHLAVDPEAPSGLAIITVDDAGENSIVVSPGANGRVSRSDVEGASAVLMAATVTLLQLEIPMEAVLAAAETSEGIVILNAAPAAHLPAALLRSIDVLVVNRGELATLTGSGDPVSARSLPVPVTVVTLGADGARIIRADAGESIAAIDVTPVDTTGAGDSFCGALAAGLDDGLSLESSVKRAVMAGSLAVTSIGARSGMPTTPELEGALLSQSSQEAL
ncbi:MAG: ribokinase [Actinomycetota bacterium]|nr:ribokinase [Actinomycetota bacterium]